MQNKVGKKNSHLQWANKFLLQSNINIIQFIYTHNLVHKLF